MNINNIQGMNAYTANARMSDTASVQNGYKQTTGTELNEGNTQTLQQAFQVEITQEAMTLQTQRQEDMAEKDQVQLLAKQNSQALQTSQIQQTGPFQNRQGAQIDVIA